MFSQYFTASYFPDGWGAVGALPEGSISGGTTFQVTASATWSALASIGGTAAFQVTAEGTASTSEAGGSASFSITATATLTYTGEPEQPATSGGGRFFRSYDRREVEPGWLQGRATIYVEGLGRLTSTRIEPPARVEPARPEIRIPAPWEPLAWDYPAPVAYVPLPAAVVPVKVEAPKPPAPALLEGAAGFQVQAAGTLTYEQIQPEPPPPYDDTEEIVLALLMLRRAA